MKTEYTGVISNGGVTFDTPLNLPENTRVVLRLAEAEPLEAVSTSNNQPLQINAPQTKEQRIAAVRKFLEIASQTRVPHADIKITRDELYERD